MRKILKGLAALFVAAGFALPVAAKADDAKSLLDQIMERGTLRVGTTGDYRLIRNSIRRVTPIRVTRSTSPTNSPLILA